MEFTRLRDCLTDDYSRMRDVAAAGDLAARVPTCPDWDLAELVDHTAMVYLHKALTMSVGEFPWPPTADKAKPPVVEFFDDCYQRLIGQFDARRPSEHSKTWYGPDQTVGFWIRRMAQETVIHRVDAELAAGVPLAAIPDDLALDGIDEVLKVFLAYGSQQWPDEFDLSGADGGAILVNANGRTWLVRPTEKGVEVSDGGGDAAATLTGSPTDVLLWLWRRAGDEALSVAGNRTALAKVREHLLHATQ